MKHKADRPKRIRKPDFSKWNSTALATASVLAIVIPVGLFILFVFLWGPYFFIPAVGLSLLVFVIWLIKGDIENTRDHNAYMENRISYSEYVKRRYNV